MAAFRKLIPLAVLVLVLGLASTASAQIFQCTATSGTATPLLRAEGFTELTGDIVLNCSGGTPTVQVLSSTGAPTVNIPQANISVFLNTAVTSRLTASSGASEALLMVDEPATAEQSVCAAATDCKVLATSTTSGTPGANPFKPNGFAAKPFNIWAGVVSGNSVTFTGIPIEPPGSTGNRIYRITNIRANASAVAPGGLGTPGQVVAQISTTPITAGASFTINNATQTIGFVQAGLKFAVYGFESTSTSSGKNFKQCENFRNSSSVASGLVDVRFTEGFASSFKPRTRAAFVNVDTAPSPAIQDVPGTIYNTESGFYSAATGSVVGLADFGTRLRVTFTNIPTGVSIYVSTRNILGSSADADLSARLIGSESGAFFPVTATATYPATSTVAAVDYAQVNLINGSGVAVWEVLGASPALIQNYDFAVFAFANANVANNLPAAGTGSAAGSFAPAPPTGGFTAAAGAVAQTAAVAVPRFSDTGTATKILGISLCRTILLFPYAVNVGGFDTGIAIANTTSDPLGTAAQSGTCDLNFYGTNAPTVLTTAAIAGGSSYVNTMGSAAPGFAGYIIAVCNFQYAHGFAFVSDVGARNLAMGYLALVIPDGGRQNTTSGVSLANGTGEVLGQ